MISPDLAETVRRLIDECFKHHAEDIKRNAQYESVPSLTRAQVDRFKLMSAVSSILDALEGLERETEQLRVQLAGCGVAAHDASVEQECPKGAYGWSQSYADVLSRNREARARITSLESSLAEARKGARTAEVAPVDAGKRLLIEALADPLLLDEATLTPDEAIQRAAEEAFYRGWDAGCAATKEQISSRVLTINNAVPPERAQHPTAPQETAEKATAYRLRSQADDEDIA